MQGVITGERIHDSLAPDARPRAAGRVAAPYRKHAIVVGLLFIIGDIAGALSLLLTNGILDEPVALGKIAAHQDQLVLGALLVLTMGFALALVPVVIYPVFRRCNQVLAIGNVVFRGALESVAYLASAGLLILLVELGRQQAESASMGAPALGSLLLTAHGSTIGYFTAIVFSIGSLMYYFVFYQSRLIPRWLSAWGLAGAVFYLAWPVLGLFGHEAGMLMAPLALAEIVIAVWLIVKGFDRRAVEALPA